ncbi:MAG: hypothetical protein JG718_09660 [Candidatus Thiothrix moscowensis]|nr:hypothetical protein [Candidatus Thiothrix moscowensis]
MVKKILITLLILSCLLVVYFFGFSDYLKIDRCLDAGGKWDDKARSCQTL